ncbi:MAG: DUF5367 family protein [Anaerolineaceae bacterium]|nr:DUF5367 family protein [Anaerolineaceae bacterium]
MTCCSPSSASASGPWPPCSCAWRGIQGLWRLRATLLLALPGMLLDVPVVHYLNDWLPNLAPSLAGSYGAWLLWAYALALLAALLPERLSLRRLRP